MASSATDERLGSGRTSINPAVCSCAQRHGTFSVEGVPVVVSPTEIFDATSTTPASRLESSRKKARFDDRGEESVETTVEDDRPKAVLLDQTAIYLSLSESSIPLIETWESECGCIPVKVMNITGNPISELLLELPGILGPYLLAISATSGDFGHASAPLGRLRQLLTGVQKQRRGSNIVSIDSYLERCTENPLKIILQSKIYWHVQSHVTEMQRKNATRTRDWMSLLSHYLPAFELNDQSIPWSPQDFYESVHVPCKDDHVSPLIQDGNLKCNLYPFQKRAVNWMLRKEGVHFKGEALAPCETESHDAPPLPPSFAAAIDCAGQKYFYSHLHGIVGTDFSELSNTTLNVRGGILAEEMGLGKTVEVIALICLHKRRLESAMIHDSNSGSTVMPTGSTLIITPRNLLQQWISELQNHAPSLTFTYYGGMPSAAQSVKRKRSISAAELLHYDVVFTTYNILSKEIWYANAGPQRFLRQEKKHERRTSPLTQVHWWRVCVDEAQMVEGGVSNAAIVARSIPRHNAWAISGTPLRKNAQDIYGLLQFLRCEPFSSDRALWDLMINHFRGTFRQIVGLLTLRHTKDKVREELCLPPQKRIVLTIPFTAVEEQNYLQLFQQMYGACGLRADGSPAHEDWDPDDPSNVNMMRIWLTRLRQTCLHPKVGSRNLRALGRGNRHLRTIEEVLEVMIDQNETNLRLEERAMILSQLTRAHIKGNDRSNPERSRAAIEDYLSALNHANEVVDDCRRELSTEIRIRKEDAALSAFDSTIEDVDSHKDDREYEKGGRSALLRKHLRSALETQHACAFFAATCYYRMRIVEEHSSVNSCEHRRLETLENDLYDKAKAIRKELLHSIRQRAEGSIRKASEKLRQVDLLTSIPHLKDYGGIENRRAMERLDYVTDALNDQAQKLIEWRARLMELLVLPLLDEEELEEITGEEYEQSTKHQDELYVYMAALRALLADRSLILTGQENVLVEHEIKQASQQAKAGEGHAPELFLRLMDTRTKLKPPLPNGSLRDIISELRSLATSLQWQKEGGSHRAAVEHTMVEVQMKKVQGMYMVQAKSTANLESELELFRIVMNQRLEYYRQLQHISDSVAPYKNELDETLDQAELEKQRDTYGRIAIRLADIKTKHRFLLHLRVESAAPNRRTLCIICQFGFENGVLTVCGHQFCRECLSLWWRSHRTCPMCKRYLNLADFHQITYKPNSLYGQEELHPVSAPDRPDCNLKGGPIYADIGRSTLNEIKAIHLDDSYGTKIDTLSRHLLWLRDNDPGAKSVIFSQYSDFLSILEGAFSQFKIGYARITSQAGVDKFRSDVSVECFLLDAKADSSGLNLVNATYVFLCEPLINTAIELQAIARVHRIGQKRTTTVFMYLIGETVEEAIYEISVETRLEHINRQAKGCVVASEGESMLQESTLDAANSFEIEQASLARLLARGTIGGEIVEKKHLWKCLFHKPRRIRYN